MQIGCCWFDAEKHRLLNQTLSRSWQMAVYESAILLQLVQHRGQVVSNQSLLQVLEASDALDARLHDIILRIRDFLGRKDAPLLEKVANQGYILHAKPTGPSLSLWRQPKRIIPVWRYLVLSVVTLALVSFMYTRVGHADFFQPHHQESLTTQQGKLLSWHWHDDKDRRAVYQTSVDSVKRELLSCKNMPWSSAFLSISEDGQILNMLFKRGAGDGVETKSVKVVVESPNLSFVNGTWLKQVGICD